MEEDLCLVGSETYRIFLKDHKIMNKKMEYKIIFGMRNKITTNNKF